MAIGNWKTIILRKVQPWEINLTIKDSKRPSISPEGSDLKEKILAVQC